jgi:hypothetical protein
VSSHEVPPPGAIPYNLRAAALDQLGHLVQVKPYRPLRDVSDVGDQDYAWTVTRTKLAPKDFPDANPNNVLASYGHRYVVDAGANLQHRPGRRHGSDAVPERRPGSQDQLSTVSPRGPASPGR